MTFKGILLITPPNFSIDQPYLSTAVLTAFLKKNGIKEVAQLDANLDSFYYFTKKRMLRQCHLKIKDELDVVQKIVFSGNEDDLIKQRYQYLCEAILYYPAIEKNITNAIRYFKTRKKTDIQEYNFNKNVVERAFDVVSSAYYPTHVTPKNFSMRFSNQNFAQIQEAIESAENPYVEYFRDEFMKKYKADKFDVIGISVTALSQIIPSFTMAFNIKKAWPNTIVVFGGQVFHRLEDNIERIAEFFEFVDYLVIGEGETPLLKLVKYLKGDDTNINHVPNLLYFEQHKKKVVRTPRTSKEDIHTLPSPDYRGLPLHKYLAPAPVLSYQPARGCYWSKCTFCNQYMVVGKGLRCKTIDEMVNDIKYLKQKYKTHYFSFVNESLPPIILRKLAEKLAEQELDIKWYAGARFDKGFDKETLMLLKKSGCEKLYFGLESGSQKVLSEMNKGTELPIIKRIVRDAKDIKIGVHLFIMIGFPTEDKCDLEASRSFIYDIVKASDKDTLSFYISIYQLKPKTLAFEKPSLFNIQHVFQKEGCDLEYLYGFKRTNPSLKNEYETAKKNLEEKIDSMTGQKRFPENIVHFLSFKECMSELVPKQKGEMVSINPHLVGREFKWYSAHKSAYLLYDFRNDSLYEVSNGKLWKFILSQQNKLYKLSELKRCLSGVLGIKDKISLQNFMKELFIDNILIKGGE